MTGKNSFAGRKWPLQQEIERGVQASKQASERASERASEQLTALLYIKALFRQSTNVSIISIKSSKYYYSCRAEAGDLLLLS